MSAEYRANPTEQRWWCNTHQRAATFLRRSSEREVPVCNPSLGGIMLACSCVDLTGEAETCF